MLKRSKQKNHVGWKWSTKRVDVKEKIWITANPRKINHLRRLQGLGVAWISNGKIFNTQNLILICLGQQDQPS